MSLPEPSFRDVDPMMRHLETAIENDIATPKLLAVMQKRLDTIDAAHRDDPAVANMYHKLLELQALIYGTQRNDAEAKKFMTGAVQMAGGADKLSSRLLRKYIHEHHSGRPAAKTAQHAAAVPAAKPQHNHSDGLRLFDMSLLRLALLSIFTAGLYNWYWFYKNWKFIKQHEQSSIWPFWRAVFSLIWAWPLFAKVLQSARRQGYDRSYVPALLAIMYILLSIASNVVDHIAHYPVAVAIISITLLVLTIWPLLIVQQAINFNNSRLPKKKIKRTVPEIIIIIIGMLLFIVYVAVLFIPLNKIEDKIVPPGQRMAAREQQQKLESLTAQYNTCASELKERVKTLDKNDPDAIDKYNSDLAKCDAVRAQQNKAVDTYDALVARKQPS